MRILTIKTDQEVAELSLFENETELARQKWVAHRELTTTFFGKLDELLESANSSLKDVEAIAVFAGPGSFTGLRIGLTIANTLAYSLNLPIVSSKGASWQNEACQYLQNGLDQRITLPWYGSDAHITAPKK